MTDLRRGGRRAQVGSKPQRGKSVDGKSGDNGPKIVVGTIYWKSWDSDRLSFLLLLLLKVKVKVKEDERRYRRSWIL